MGALAGLHVAYVAFDPFPNLKGSGTRILELSSALASAGASVSLVTLPATTRVALHPRVRLVPIPLVESNYLARAVGFRDAVARSLVSLRPDVVHFRGPFEGQAALAHGGRSPVRVVFEVNGLPSIELAYHHPAVLGAPAFLSRLEATERRLLAASHAILTQSRATARFLALRGAPPERICVIPNGAHRASDSDGRARTGRRVRLLYAGTLAPWQGLPELLTAVGRAARDVDVGLTVVGWGQKHWRRDLERRVRRLHLSERVEVRPSVSREELRALIRSADICAAPLRRDRRNRVQGCSPIKLFEYMAAGRAVLSTRLPCLEEIVTHEQTGFLARPSSSRELSAALGELAADEGLRRRLGRAARAEVEASATWEHRAGELVRFYEERVLARASA